MISTHILDTTLGKPAAQVKVILELESTPGQWSLLASEHTNSDGRIVFTAASRPGNYRLVFGIEEYFRGLNREHFFKDVPVVFTISDTQRKYHVPLLLNPYGYSTYRGS